MSGEPWRYDAIVKNGEVVSLWRDDKHGDPNSATINPQDNMHVVAFNYGTTKGETHSVLATDELDAWIRLRKWLEENT